MDSLNGMTLYSVYKQGEKSLCEAGVPDADFDSLYLLEHFFGADRTKLILHGERKADETLCERFFKAVNERITGKPLQYIVGKWNFMGYDFVVGEGVLIPRDDTEVVVEAALDFLKNVKCPKVIDLCSGSGAIAVAIAKLMPDSEVTALEYSDLAIEYLKKNIKLFDLVISNPPYIRSKQIDTLQIELQFEPRMALDGGRDGLYFYRSIVKNWSSKVKPNGMIAFEVGEEQFEPVAEEVSKQGFENIVYRLDLQGFKRTVSGIKK